MPSSEPAIFANLIEALPDPPKEEGSSEPTPYLSPEIGACFLDPMVDEFYQTECYIWCQIVLGDGDWELEVGGEEFVGVPPDWWGYSIDSGDCGVGLEYLLIPSGSKFKAMDWALREGLQPGQWFCVYVPQPYWFKCGYEYVEWDFECDPYIIRKENLKTSARSLEEFVVEVIEFSNKTEQKRKDNLKARWAATSRLELTHIELHGHRWSTALRLHLDSTLVDVEDPARYGRYTLASGYSETGSYEEALTALSAQVAGHRPDLTLEVLKGLPSRFL